MSRAIASADIFQAIADPTRRGILAALADGDKPVGDLAECFAMTISAVSQHLSILRQAGLVTVRPAGRQRFYRLDGRPLQSVSEWADQYESFWLTKLDALGRHLDQKSSAVERDGG